MSGFRDLLSNYSSFQKQKKANAPYSVQCYNFWTDEEIRDMWFYRFVMHRNIVKQGKKLCFFSTFGNRDLIDKVYGDVNVFFTGENLKRQPFRQYTDHLLNNKKLNLALGFEYFDDYRYLRFPLWLHYMFPPESTIETIRERCNHLTHPAIGNRSRFACHVSGEDFLGLRKTICESLSHISRIDCAGKTLHNCDELWNNFKDDKHSFLQQYKINICPENSNADGYVTEKVFQSIDSGCIPVYWGSYNNPEPEVLNSAAILFWNYGVNNGSLINQIKEINLSNDCFLDFAKQPRLVPTAAEYVINEFEELEIKLKSLLSNV